MKKIRKKWGDRIYLEWRDANNDAGWKTYDEAMKIDKEDYLCKTNAFFIGQSDGFIVIAHTIGAKKDLDVTGILKIPSAWIIKVK